MNLDELKIGINYFLNRKEKKNKKVDIYFFVKTETAEVIQKFVKEEILNEYRRLEDFNSYIDLCFGSGNLSIHILEALEFFENNQAKIKEGKKVVFNDKYDFANWELKDKVEGINFIQKDVFTADFFEDDKITSKENIENEEPDELSMFITYLKYENAILDTVKSFYGNSFIYELKHDNNGILKEKNFKLKKKNKIKASIQEKEILLKILNKEFSFSDEREENEEVLNKIIEETKNKVKNKYIPKTFDFITANFLMSDAENAQIGSILFTESRKSPLIEKRKIILNVIFEYFLSENGIFLFVKKTSSENDFEELENIFGKDADYIAVFNVPEMTNEVNFILKKPNQEEVVELKVE